MSRDKLLTFTFVVALALMTPELRAQNKTPETVGDDQETLKVFVNEVRIPITAYDEYGHFDPTVEADDLMVKEDGVLRPLKSIYRIPAGVLLLLDTGGELNLAKNVRLTRETAIGLVSSLKKEDQVNVIQVNNRVELVQDWTTDKSEVIHALRNKLLPGKRSALAQGIDAAVEQLEKTPMGNRHLVLISDGIDSQTDRTEFARALSGLVEANITTHVISYTSLGLTAKKPPVSRPRLKSAIPEEAIIPLPRMRRPREKRPDPKDILEAKGGTTIDLERLFRRGAGIKEELKRREKELGSLAEETGGGFWLPVSAEEMVQQAVEVAEEVDSQYVVTYALQRPVSAEAGEYLKLDVISRRVGLNIRARRGYLAKPHDTPPPNNQH
ncbi:MAG TPA: VWA domain-containing protein [Pyrinomonadaceae bacterium]|nr:VWA domain-containing protein [Pyrinomonadaceae bacterium]